MKCSKQYFTQLECMQHEKKCSASPSARPVHELKYGCQECSDRFRTRHELHRHSGLAHPQSGSGELQARPWDGDENSTMDSERRYNQ